MREEEIQRPPEEDQSEKSDVFDLGVGVVIVMVALGTIDADFEQEKQSPFTEENIAFCHDPDLTPHYLQVDVPYKLDWERANRFYVQQLEFGFNETTTQQAEDFFASIPQNVKDNPDITFVVSGHATLAPHKTIAEDQSNNIKIAQDRMEYVANGLDVPMDRVRMKNYGSSYNKQAVNVQLCAPDIGALGI